jgi:mRNA interferase MazF
MEKNFTEWNGVKQNIHDIGKQWFCYERGVYWCSLGLNVGFEVDGKGSYYRRPVLVIKKINQQSCICVPLTTKSKNGSGYYELNLGDKIRRWAVLFQLRCFDTKRMGGTLGIVGENQFQEIKQAIIEMFR